MTKMHARIAGASIAAVLLAVSVPAALGHGNQESWGANFGRGYGMAQPGHMHHGPGGYPGHGGYGPMECPMGAGMMHQGHMGYGGHRHGMRAPGPMAPGPMGHGPMAPGHMGPGMMDPGHMGPGMMDRGPLGLGPGWIYGRPPLPEPDVDSVRETLEEDLAWHGNPRLKLGEVREQDDDTIVAEIVTQDGSLVQRFEIDRRTGRWRQAD